jgi:hypothetical protein
MALPQIKFSKTSPTPLRVTVQIGNLVYGHYELYLWDATGTNQSQIGEGVNNDDDPDVVQLPQSPASYDGQTIEWRLDAAPLPNGDATYQAAVTVLQGQQALPGGTFSWSGDLGSGQEIVGGAVLVGT